MMRPETEVELAEMIAGAEGPLAICGGGTRGFDGAGDRLSTRSLTGVELYEPGALTMVARAGTPVAEIEALLAENGQRLAFEVMDHRGVLGAVASQRLEVCLQRMSPVPDVFSVARRGIFCWECGLLMARGKWSRMAAG